MSALRIQLDAELHRPVPPAVMQLAQHLADRARGRAAAVLFYGSALRDPALEGVLDFYILLDTVSAWPGSRIAALANRWLPPNVGYLDGELPAKYAVMSLAQFREAMSALALDTTLWARFSQPCACVFVRSEKDREAVIEALAHAHLTAARWAAELGPERGHALDYWRALFALTYAAELRVEKIHRGEDLVARDAQRYADLLPLAWREDGIDFDRSADGMLTPRITRQRRDAAARRWKRRERLGKPLNIARLLKAAFTFDGAMDYAAWKIERHSGVRLDVQPWQRRHPLLAAPGVYLRLRKLGVLR